MLIAVVAVEGKVIAIGYPRLTNFGIGNNWCMLTGLVKLFFMS